jgi:hypothetical protein
VYRDRTVDLLPRLRRRGSLPLPLKLVLFGPGTVHGLDDAEHHLRNGPCSWT